MAMNVFEMVVVIVVVVFTAQVVKAWIKRGGGNASLPPEQQQRIDRLEQRVKHLEAVVSDPDSQLREKFRELDA